MHKMFHHARRAATWSLNVVGLSLAVGAQAQQPLLKLRTVKPLVLQRSALLGRHDPSQVLHITVSLATPNKAALEAYAKSVSNPSSPNYGAFLTPAQFGSKFGQSAANVKKTVDYLKSQGLKIKMIGDNNLSLLVDGTVAQVESAFHTAINDYRSLDSGDKGRKEFYSYSNDLALPQDISSFVGSVSGLSNHARPIPRLKRLAKKVSGSPLTPQQASVLYNIAPLHSSNYYGQERTVAITSFDGFDLNNAALLYSQFNLPVPAAGVVNNIKVETVDGGSQQFGQEGEGDLDIQMVLSQAPLCKLIVYDGGDDLLPVLAQEAQDNSADIITESYGWAYDATQAESAHELHLQLTAQGITYFLASGDDGTTIDSSGGTYGDYDTEVTNVGGTVATTTSTGSRISEVGWFGSAGGWVTTPTVPFNTLPSWQKGTGVPTSINFRLIPDVALHAAGSNDSNQDPGAYQFFYQGAPSTNDGTWSGTSFSSPVFAGAFACVEARLIDRGVLKAGLGGLARFGRINDLIYQENGVSSVWYDVTSGNNGALPSGQQSNAGKGWDFVTGWGSVNFAAWAAYFAIPAPTIINPASANVFNFGQNPTGTAANLAANDGKYFSVTSVPTSVGALAAHYAIFNVAQAPASLSQLSLTLEVNATPGVSLQVVLYNYSTNLWNTVSTTSLTSANSKIFINPWNFNQFVSSTGQFKAVLWAVNPKGTQFTLNDDQAILTATPQAP